MSATERFSIIVTAIGVVSVALFGGIGYLFKRMFDKYDSLNAERQKLVLDATNERQATNDRHAARNAEQITILTNVVASNQTKLTDLYAEMSTRIARIEGKLGAQP